MATTGSATVRARSSGGALADLADFGRRLWVKGGEDDVLFLAGGVAFNILLAGVPFFLLLASGLGYVLGKSQAASNTAVIDFITDLFPDTWSGKGSVLDPVVKDIVRTRGTVGTFGAIAFVWFSTRFFGSLRTVFNRVFNVEKGHGLFIGKLYDIWYTVSATALVVAWIGSAAYFTIARTHGLAFLARLGAPEQVVIIPIADRHVEYCEGVAAGQRVSALFGAELGGHGKATDLLAVMSDDAQSRVAKLQAEQRNYTILADLNTRPRTSYLGAVRNVNPEIGEA